MNERLVMVDRWSSSPMGSSGDGVEPGLLERLT